MKRFSKSSLFPDVNVWLALTYEGHVHHSGARRWLASGGQDSRLFFCRVTQLSLLRLLTTEAVMGKEVLNLKKAWHVYDRWIKDHRVALLPEPIGLDRPFRRVSRSNQPSPKDWADSYLAAFAFSAELTLVTFDQALHRRVTRSVLLSAEV
jgi:toxin-antitoxin system PIN domain toxin